MKNVQWENGKNKMNEELQIYDPFGNISFRGNPKIKGPDFSIDVTQKDFEHYTREIIRCSKNILYFANNYYTIVSPEKGKHIIITFSKQEELIEKLQSENRLVVLSSRQTSKTTSYCIFGLHTCCFSRDKKILIIANKEKTALEILDRIKLAYEDLPKWIKPGIKTWNKGTVEFSNGCKIEGVSTSSDSARSKSADILIIDECSFIDNSIMNKLWASIYPIISSSKKTKIIMVSTPNGTGNLFYETYESARLGTSKLGWKDFRMDWWDFPGRDEEWKEQTLASLNYDEKVWNQEFNNQFLGSTYTLINSNFIERHKEHIAELKNNNISHKIKSFQDFEVKLWYEPLEKRCYVIGADVSDGVGVDSSVATVFDITEPKHIREVANFSNNKITTSEFSYVLSKLGKYYNNAALLVESNSMGRAVLEVLHLIYEYENLVSTESKNFGVRISNNKVKIDLCLNFKKFLENRKINVELNNPFLVQELEYFERYETANGHTYKSKKGKHDDHIMSAILAYYIFKPQILEYFFNAEYEKMDMDLMPSKIRPINAGHFTDYSKEESLKRIDEIYNNVNSNKDINYIVKKFQDTDFKDQGLSDISMNKDHSLEEEKGGYFPLVGGFFDN